MATAALNDIATALGTTKNKGSNDAKATVKIGVSLISGKAVSNACLQKKIAKRLNINRGCVLTVFSTALEFCQEKNNVERTLNAKLDLILCQKRLES